MDTTFLSCLLVFALLSILVLYLYQTLPKTSNSTPTGNKGEAFLPIIFDTCKSQRTSGMPVHRVGPVHNFHQTFNKYNPKLTVEHPASIPQYPVSMHDLNGVGYPTGIPEMGWRNFYLANFSQNQVPPQDPFSGTPIRNFLNNLENVDNLYRKCS